MFTFEMFSVGIVKFGLNIYMLKCLKCRFLGVFHEVSRLIPLILQPEKAINRVRETRKSCNLVTEERTFHHKNQHRLNSFAVVP